MTVFELVHSYDMFEGEVIYSTKMLGYFADKKAVDDAIEYYRTVMGFCDAPNGFSVRRLHVVDAVADDTVYQAQVYAHSYDYYYEYAAELGVFADKEEAEQAIRLFRDDNEVFYSNTQIEIEEIIDLYKINERCFLEGFTVEAISG